MRYDILIKNAKIRRQDELVDIAVLDGKITAIEKNITEEASKTMDASGNLVTECKRPSPSGQGIYAANGGAGGAERI